MRFNCPHCGQSINANEPVQGVTHTCPKCGKLFRISGPEGSRVSQNWMSTRRLWLGKIKPGADTGETISGRRDESTPAQSIPGSSPEAGGSPEMTTRLEPGSRLSLHEQSVGESGQAWDMPPHYEILGLIGEGGMGSIYNARQTSLDRRIALKMLKSEAARDRYERGKFLTEAMTTAELEHPNIVPIHDLGRNSDGLLFYAMKEVRGVPWHQVLLEKGLDENLDIWMRLADAVAFAHSKGIIHRDLKPANVMIGDYGEVVLMDWGLAVAFQGGAKAECLDENVSSGGTPCYMAPEMAACDFTKMGPRSDVYLLGAILFEIVTGRRPHSGRDAEEAIEKAARNEVEPPGVSGELIDIAMRAMATEPDHRYAGVKEIQAAVKQYRRHAESISLAARARASLGIATGSGEYDSYAQAMFGYREALKAWRDNRDAQSGLLEAQLAYAQCAFGREDYDLAASLLDKSEPRHQALFLKIRDATQKRDDLRREFSKREKRWQTVLVDDFSDAGSAGRWKAVYGSCRVEPGRLVCSAGTEKGVQVVLNADIAGDVRVTFRGKAADGELAEIALSIFGTDDDPCDGGYFLSLNRARGVRLDRRTITVWNGEDMHFDPRKTYCIQFERSGSRIRVFVDDMQHPVLDFNDWDSPFRPQNKRLGFYAWRGEFEISGIEIDRAGLPLRSTPLDFVQYLKSWARYDMAIACLDDLLKTSDDRTELEQALVARAECLEYSGRERDAEEAYEELLGRFATEDNTFRFVHFRIRRGEQPQVVVDSVSGRYPDSDKWFDTALIIFAKAGEKRQELNDGLMAERFKAEMEIAAACVARVTGSHKGKEARHAFSQSCMTLSIVLRGEIACWLMELAARISPETPIFLSYLAYMLQESGHLEHAVEVHRKYLATTTSDASAWRQLGEALAGLGRKTEADGALAKARELGA